MFLKMYWFLNLQNEFLLKIIVLCHEIWIKRRNEVLNVDAVSAFEAL